LNKRGFFGDVVFIGVLLLVVALSGMFVFYLLDIMQSKFETVSSINGTDFGRASLGSMSVVADKMDYLFMAFFLASTLGLLIVSWFVPINFVFAGIYFVVAILAVVLSAIFSNIWESVSSSASFAVTVLSIPVTNYVLLHLPIFIGSVCFLGMVAMFAKAGSSQ
jgi:hypothetical protein